LFFINTSFIDKFRTWLKEALPELIWISDIFGYLRLRRPFNQKLNTLNYGPTSEGCVVSSYTQIDKTTTNQTQNEDTLAQRSDLDAEYVMDELEHTLSMRSDDDISISQRLSDLRTLMENRQGRRITDEELASRFRVSKSSIGNWKRDMVKTLLPETERRFQELYDEALGERSHQEEGDFMNQSYPKADSADAIIDGTVAIVATYLERCRENLSADDLRNLIIQVKRGLIS
jgi:hypothetical protein